MRLWRIWMFLRNGVLVCTVLGLDFTASGEALVRRYRRRTVLRNRRWSPRPGKPRWFSLHIFADKQKTKRNVKNVCLGNIFTLIDWVLSRNHCVLYAVHAWNEDALFGSKGCLFPKSKSRNAWSHTYHDIFTPTGRNIICSHKFAPSSATLSHSRAKRHQTSWSYMMLYETNCHVGSWRS